MGMNRKLTIIAIFATSVLAPSCSEDAAGPCDLWVAFAVVSGRVTDSGSGAPIVNTEIDVMVAEGSQCDGSEQWIETRRVTTDNAGQFSLKLGLGNQNGVRCVGAQETNSGRITRDTVEFVGGCNDTRPPGRVNLDISI